MAWTWVLSKLPWRTILTHAPTFVDAARRFRRQTTEAERPEPPTAGGLEELQRAVEQLRERDMQQAALITDLAKQGQELATALDVLRARMRLAFIGTALAIGLVILALFLGR